MSLYDTRMENLHSSPICKSSVAHGSRAVFGLQCQEMWREFSCVTNEYLSKTCGFVWFFFNSFEHAHKCFCMQDPCSYNNGDLITVPVAALSFEKCVVSASFLVFIYCWPVLDHIALENKKYFNWNFALHSYLFCWFEFRFKTVLRLVLRLSLVQTGTRGCAHL